MKIIKLSVFILAILLCQTVLAQEKKTMTEPEYIGVFFYLEENGNLVALERQTPESKFKLKALGYGGGESLLRIKGEKSTVRFKADQKLAFVVRVASQAVDPMSIIEFFRFEAKKGYRQLTVVKVGTMGMNSKSTVSEFAVQFNVAKYGESSFKVVPANALIPGEYCLSGGGGKDGFCFGIDTVSSGTK